MDKLDINKISRITNWYLLLSVGIYCTENWSFCANFESVVDVHDLDRIQREVVYGFEKANVSRLSDFWLYLGVHAFRKSFYLINQLKMFYMVQYNTYVSQTPALVSTYYSKAAKTYLLWITRLEIIET